MFEFKYIYIILLYIFETLKYIATLMEGLTIINFVYNNIFIKKKFENQLLSLTTNLYNKKHFKNIINDLTANLEKELTKLREHNNKLEKELTIVKEHNNKLEKELTKEKILNYELNYSIMKICFIYNN